MQNDNAHGQLSRFWRKYFYDRDCALPEWNPHPHCRFKPVGRFLSALMGSIVAVGAILIRTGVTTKLDDGSLLIGWTFWVVAVTGGVLWLVAVLTTASTEQKRMLHYVFAGIQPPAAVAIAFQLIKGYA